jgi:hypothetical protein
MFNAEAVDIASRCRHYAMCKIDFLETGICKSGIKKHYVSYYPQGRMDIYYALSQQRIPVSQGLLDIADTCNLCGHCEKQCYFITQLRPMKVMRELKAFVDDYQRNGLPLWTSENDDVLSALQTVVGEVWATNDPAILASYAGDLVPISDWTMPQYVVLPASRRKFLALLNYAINISYPMSLEGMVRV